MKKYTYYALAIAIFTLSTTACSSKDNDADLVGSNETGENGNGDMQPAAATMAQLAGALPNSDPQQIDVKVLTGELQLTWSEDADPDELTPTQNALQFVTR